MATQMDYTLGINIKGSSVADVEKVIRESLSKEGFGVLTEIDVQATMKKKLDVDRKPYLILGACNPQLANKAIDAEPSIGALLPCNVIIYEQDDGSVAVEALDPRGVFSLVNNEEVQPVADEVAQTMTRILDDVAEQFTK